MMSSMIDNILRTSEAVSSFALSSDGPHKTPRDVVASFGMLSPSEVLAAETMADLLPNSVQSVLELTQGQGRLFQVFCSRGYEVISQERCEGINPSPRLDGVLIIPPFIQRVENEYLKIAMDASDIVLALMPRFTLMISAGRTAELVKWGLRSLTHFLWPTFMDSQVQSCIFQLERGYKGIIEIKFVGGVAGKGIHAAKRYAVWRSILGSDKATKVCSSCLPRPPTGSASLRATGCTMREKNRPLRGGAVVLFPDLTVPGVSFEQLAVIALEIGVLVDQAQTAQS
jgi:hypothetical protein